MKVMAKSLIINVIGIMPKALGASLEKLKILRKIETVKAVQVVGKYNEDEAGDLTRFGVGVSPATTNQTPSAGMQANNINND